MKERKGITRRDLLKGAVIGTAAVGAGSALGILAPPGLRGVLWNPRTALAFYRSPGATITKFAQALRGVFPLDPNGIPVAVPDGTFGVGGALHYKIDIKQYQDLLHPNLGGLTTLRGYKPRDTLGGSVPQRHLGGIIVANNGTPSRSLSQTC
jgi:hypothetical protein